MPASLRSLVQRPRLANHAEQTLDFALVLGPFGLPAFLELLAIAMLIVEIAFTLDESRRLLFDVALLRLEPML